MYKNPTYYNSAVHNYHIVHETYDEWVGYPTTYNIGVLDCKCGFIVSMQYNKNIGNYINFIEEKLRTKWQVHVLEQYQEL